MQEIAFSPVSEPVLFELQATAAPEPLTSGQFAAVVLLQGVDTMTVSGSGNSESGGLWDAGRVAAELGCSVKTVYRKTRSGVIPCVRVFGTMVRYRPKDIVAMVDGGGR